MRLIRCLFFALMFRISMCRARRHMAKADEHLRRHQFWKWMAEDFDAKASAQFPTSNR